jgi:preprotein translocase subunit SecA
MFSPTLLCHITFCVPLTTRRVLELRHYDVQLMGGLILHDGRLAEMATGEGKTLVATLPTYVNALLSGQSSFVITVNDYLARRDMEKMGQIHRFLGLSVGLIQSNMTPDQRRKAYACDVVYVTNTELGFDYLRDHLALSTPETVLLRGEASTGDFNAFCVVDEADSVLIDEARTPLIISKQVAAPASKYKIANQLAGALKKDLHYSVDLKNKNVILNDLGYRDSEKALRVDSLFSLDTDGEAWAPFIANALKAKELFTKDVEYTVLFNKQGKASGVGIIDSFTGRVLDGRRWSDGLHQSIETMEGIDVSEQSKVIAKVTYQALFRQFSRLSGMTGTAMADADELEQVYGLKVTPVPTALPIARRDYPDVVFKTRTAANEALVKEIKNTGGGQSDGRPCLVGTTSVLQSEVIVQLLSENGIQAELLNASPKNAPRESEIVAQAGRAGAVTVATNMAGRGTDILLGGCPSTMTRIKARSVLLENGVLNSIEAALFPPSPANAYFPCDVDSSVIDILIKASQSIKQEFGEEMTAIEFDEVLTVAFDATETEDDPAYVVLLREAAGMINDSFGPILAEEKEAVRKSGGLYVMGTNRHESSRIDRQLRGRAGRQGDPGSSRFFLSFEDDMLVVFGGEGLKKILAMFRVTDDMPIEAKQVSESIDKIQMTVEEKFRTIRNEIFNFDEVLNKQRRVVYKRRRQVLYSSAEETFEIMCEYNKQVLEKIVQAQTGAGGVSDTPKLYDKVVQFFPLIEDVVKASDLENQNAYGLLAFLTAAVDQAFRAKAQAVDEQASKSGKAPCSTGRSAHYIILATMDNAWSDHLQSMENLKESVILRKYQGRDPVSEYEKEAFILFKDLEDRMQLNAVFSLWQGLRVSREAAVQPA